MSIEQRLAEALQSAEFYRPSPDLWDRVVHSIEEDRLHRQRVRRVLGAIAVVVGALGAIAAANVQSTPSGHRISWQWLEALVAIALVVLTVALGPALRRFGRGIAGEVFRAHPPAGERMLRLLDVAYYLAFAGYVLVTTRLHAPDAFVNAELGGQIEEALWRIGGLLIVMGILHAITLMSLPLVGLVFTTNRYGGKLPRWVMVVLLVASMWVAFQVLGLIIGLVSLGAG